MAVTMGFFLSRRFKMHRGHLTLNRKLVGARPTCAHAYAHVAPASSISASTFYGRFGNALVVSLHSTLVPLQFHSATQMTTRRNGTRPQYMHQNAWTLAGGVRAPGKGQLR